VKGKESDDGRLVAVAGETARPGGGGSSGAQPAQSNAISGGLGSRRARWAWRRPGPPARPPQAATAEVGADKAVKIANYLCPGNYAVSGSKEGCDAVVNLGKSFKARWEPGPVPLGSCFCLGPSFLRPGGLVWAGRGGGGGGPLAGQTHWKWSLKRMHARTPVLHARPHACMRPRMMVTRHARAHAVHARAPQDDGAAGGGGRVPHRVHEPRRGQAAGAWGEGGKGGGTRAGSRFANAGIGRFIVTSASF
jgi:hypothetical protein